MTLVYYTLQVAQEVFHSDFTQEITFDHTNLQSMPAARVVFGSSLFPINDMNVCFAEALLLAVHSCPTWPRDKDLPNVPVQADNLKKVFQGLGLNVTRPQQEELTHEGVKLCVADLCRRTSRKLKTIKEDALFVAVAVLSHGRLSDTFSELPAMVCYDSLGILDASNDADLDGILLSGFNGIKVPVGKRLKVWLILDCCQSNEHLSTWRGPAANLEMKLQRITFGPPSSVDLMTLLSCDPGRESHDIYSMSWALAEVLEPKKPILLHVACESAMKSVEGSTNGMVRPSLKQRGDFSSFYFFSHNSELDEADTSTEDAVVLTEDVCDNGHVFSFSSLLSSHLRVWAFCGSLALGLCAAFFVRRKMLKTHVERLEFERLKRLELQRVIGRLERRLERNLEVLPWAEVVGSTLSHFVKGL